MIASEGSVPSAGWTYAKLLGCLTREQNRNLDTHSVAELFVSAVASGMRTLKMDGMEKIMMGLTDLKQVRSVCIK